MLYVYNIECIVLKSFEGIETDEMNEAWIF